MMEHRITAELNMAREVVDRARNGRSNEDGGARDRMANIDCTLLCDRFRVAASLLATEADPENWTA
jgi:hypothetical protein